MPFTHINIKQDLEDLGPRFDGAPDLEFRAATKVLELEQAATRLKLTECLQENETRHMECFE